VCGGAEHADASACVLDDGQDVLMSPSPQPSSATADSSNETPSYYTAGQRARTPPAYAAQPPRRYKGCGVKRWDSRSASSA
jgi:hypothetical protein